MVFSLRRFLIHSELEGHWARRPYSPAYHQYVITHILLICNCAYASLLVHAGSEAWCSDTWPCLTAFWVSQVSHSLGFMGQSATCSGWRKCRRQYPKVCVTCSTLYVPGACRTHPHRKPPSLSNAPTSPVPSIPHRLANLDSNEP